MAKNRMTIPNKVKALLQQEINSMCPLCDDINVDHFEIHHIDEVPDNNDSGNLLMLCPICHSKITKKDITNEQIVQVKAYLTLKKNSARNDKNVNSIKIRGNIKSSTIANSINAQTIIYKSPSKPKIEYAEGSIGRNVECKNYTKHLIDRYNEYKESEVGKSKLKYAAIYGSIKNEFKASAFQIPEHQFVALSSYLQNRIDNTRLGRINRGKGIKNYSMFEDIYPNSK
jgi:hypothetical protein